MVVRREMVRSDRCDTIVLMQSRELLLHYHYILYTAATIDYSRIPVTAAVRQYQG